MSFYVNKDDGTSRLATPLGVFDAPAAQQNILSAVSSAPTAKAGQ